MAQKVRIDGLTDAILENIKEFNNLTEAEFEETARIVAKEGSKKLRATSPKGSGSRKGHYADGWSVTYERKGNGKFAFIVHNRKKPGLTHLLERGHQLWQGGRARAIPHIKPVEEWCNEEFERRVKERLGR